MMKSVTQSMMTRWESINHLSDINHVFTFSVRQFTTPSMMINATQFMRKNVRLPMRQFIMRSVRM